MARGAMIPCLTIAGSDSSGGAGIQADLKTFAAHGVYGMSVITAVTAQNTLGVSAIHPVPADIVQQQLNAVLSDIPPAAIKIGMLGDVDTVQAITAELAAYKDSAPNTSIVLDPVMISSSGHRLISDDTLQVLVEDLIPLADIITPNTAELKALLEWFGLECAEITNKAELETATVALSKKLSDLIEASPAGENKLAPAILGKGGHLTGDATDLLLHQNELHGLTSKRIDNTNTHGTGCTLSSAIAVQLAKQQPLKTAVEEAKNYLTQAISQQLDLGNGIGPLKHSFKDLA